MTRGAAALCLLASSVAAAQERDLEIPSGDVTIHAHEVGDPRAPEVLIAIHGGPGLASDYMAPLARLAGPGRRVVLYDQRGSGRSTRSPTRDYTLAAQLADLDAVRAAVGAERVVLVGHSWGTVIALAYAFENAPLHVSKVVLVGMGAPTAAEDRRSFGAAFAARRDKLQRAGIIPRVRPPPSGDDCIAAFNATLPAHFADARHPGARRLAGSYHCDVTHAALRGAGEWDFRGDLENFAVPLLLVIGDADANFAGCRETAALVPAEKAVLGVLRECGHFPFIECPDAFYGMVSRFLSE
jgi:proline iminopeptidase